MPARPIAMAALGILLAVTACHDATGSGNGWSGTVDTVAGGTVLVRNEAQPILAGASGWRLEEELRIGTQMGEGPGAFGRIGALLADSGGRAYVLDTQAREVRVFGPDGAYLRTIGRAGEGPGEFKSPAAMGWGPGGVLRVVDLGNGRVSEFRTTGELEGEHPLPGGFFISPWPGRFEPDGGLVAPVPRSIDGEFSVGLVRYDADMVPGDTLSPPDFDGEPRMFELPSEDGGGIKAGVPYAGGVAWDLDASGTFWVARNTARYRIDRIGADGDTLVRIERTFAPAAVTRPEVDSAIAGMKWFTDQGGRVDRSQFPERKPAIVRLWVSSTGHLLVQPTTSAFGSGWSAPAELLDVFEPDGRYLTELPLPPGFATAAPRPLFTESHVYAVVRDELDVPYVVRYRLVRPAASS